MRSDESKHKGTKPRKTAKFIIVIIIIIIISSSSSSSSSSSIDIIISQDTTQFMYICTIFHRFVLMYINCVS